jgi:hypothetical protein
MSAKSQMRTARIKSEATPQNASTTAHPSSSLQP